MNAIKTLVLTLSEELPNGEKLFIEKKIEIKRHAPIALVLPNVTSALLELEREFETQKAKHD